MVRTRRAAASKSDPNTAQIGRKRVKYPVHTCSNLRSIQLSMDASPDALLDHCFDMMLPHIWYKVIPSSANDIESMAFSIGQSWGLILPLLMKLKFMKAYKDDIRINHNKF